MRELERDEREQRSGRRIAPHPSRPLEHRSRLASSQLEEPDGGVGDRAPRAEDAPDVPEEDREQRDPEPEDDVDERGREVQELDRRAEQRGRKRQDEKPGRQGAEHDANGAREHDGRDDARQRSAVRVRLEQRPAPEIEEEDERDDEDDGRADEEVDRGDRQVADDADPVGE